MTQAPFSPPKSPVYTHRRMNPFTDDLRHTIIANIKDMINQSFAGWEQACRFEDEGMQNYYMNFIRILTTTLEKVKRF